MSYYDYNWNRNFELLKEYLKDNHEYPNRNLVYKGIKLGSWVNTQRTIYNKGTLLEDGSIVYDAHKLSKERIDKLKSISFIFSVYEKNWHSNYEKMIRGCYDKDVLNWMHLQRTIYNWGIRRSDGTFIYNGHILTKEQIKMLNDINFIWNVDIASWNKFFNLLLKYLKEYNNYPKVNEVYEGANMGNWMHIIRVVYANGTEDELGNIIYLRNILYKYQIEMLDSINFRWFVREKRFNKREVKTQGQMEGTRRFILYKYRSILELKRSANEITNMIEQNMLTEFKEDKKSLKR